MVKQLHCFLNSGYNGVKFFVLFLLFTILHFASPAQVLDNLKVSTNASEKFRAVHWGIQDGLSQACVYQMLKDKNGFVWMGTQGGLSRFDGSEFKNYYYDPQKSGTINAENTSFGLVEDSLHNLWIGTNRGLYRYDMKADTFTRFLKVFPFWATKNEVLCIDESGPVISINTNSFEKKTVAAITPADSAGAGLQSLSTFFDEKTNSLWILRSRRDNTGWHGNGLLEINITTGERRYFDWKCYKNIPGHDHSAESMRYDAKRNSLWINSGEGLMQFTLADKKFHFIGTVNDFFNAKDYYRWMGITLDKEGRVWLATIPKGVVIYNPDDNSVTFPFPEGSALQKEIAGNNAVLYCDRDGIVWSGFWLGKGVYQILPFSPAFKHYKTNPSTAHGYGIGTIYNFKNAGQGKIWIGSVDKVHRIFDTRADTFTVIPENDLPAALRQSQIIPLLIDTIKRKSFLYGISRGIWALDMNTNMYQPVGLKGIDNREIKPAGWGLSGASEFKDGLIFYINEKDRQRLFFVHRDSVVAREMYSFQTDGGAKRFVLKLTNDGFMFLKGLGDNGNLTYSFRNQSWVQSANPLDSIPWQEIIFSPKDQTYWVVALKQLIHYSRDFNVMEKFTTEDGLPAQDIFSLIADSKGSIWFNTDRSIHQLNTETKVFSTLSEKDGFQSQNFSPAAYMSLGADGKIYLGGGVDQEGFMQINPGRYSNTPSSVYLKSINVNQKLFPLSTDVDYLKEISLRYFQKNITIETGTIDYYSKGKSGIRYKVEEINDSWQYAPANYTIRYDGLSPGQYTLQIQSSNAAKEFIGPVKTLIFQISPPWWNTWWAYVIYLLIFLAALRSFSHWREKRLRRDKEILEDKVDERTKALNQSLDNLKATQSKLIHAEKMASLGELTAGIAHEIQNPLNFVNNFSEVNKELTIELEEELEKGNIDDVRNIAKDIRDNEEKINHHGKRADAIVKNMLQHSRAAGGIKEPTNINALADEYLRLAYHGLRAKDKLFNAALITNYDGNIGNINIIAQDIGRVLLNLYNNAFYAVREKNKTNADFLPEVSVSTRKMNDTIEIIIRDNGNGIPAAIVNKIFQPFFTTKPTGEGTGLGLSLAYDIVKAHGGELKVVTKEGEGSTFIITLIP
jgi:signal transduction histidine kinase/ligand-binding sensor domain-containing protein